MYKLLFIRYLGYNVKNNLRGSVVVLPCHKTVDSPVMHGQCHDIEQVFFVIHNDKFNGDVCSSVLYLTNKIFGKLLLQFYCSKARLRVKT